MAASLRTRKKSTAQPTTQELTLLLAKSIGIDLTQEYDPDAFASFAVDMYQSTDPDVYTEQGAYIYNLLQQLYVATPETQQNTVIVQTERRTKVWFTRENCLRSVTDADIVDTFLNNPSIIKVSSLLNEDYTQLELLVLEDIDD